MRENEFMVHGLLSIVVILFILKIVGINFFPTDIITVYPINCSNNISRGIIIDSTKCKSPIPLDIEQYKISYEKQQVIQNDLGITKLTNCTVWDNNNWQCDYSDKSAHFDMNEYGFTETTFDQKLHLPSTDAFDNTKYYTSRLNWLWMRNEHNALLFIFSALVSK